MSELQRPRNQEPSEQEIRDHYVQALGFPQELRRGEGTTEIGTHELGEMAYEEQALELGTPLLPATKDFPPFSNR